MGKVEDNPNEEQEANAFASYFLMPADSFKSQWRDAAGLGFVDRVLRVKRIFRVSYLTVLYRLVEMKLVDRETVWPFFKAEYKRRYHLSLANKFEPEAIVEPKGKLEPKSLDELDFVEDRLRRLIREAIESEKITVSRGAEILGVSLSDMRDAVASWEIAA